MEPRDLVDRRFIAERDAPRQGGYWLGTDSPVV